MNNAYNEDRTSVHLRGAEIKAEIAGCLCDNADLIKPRKIIQLSPNISSKINPLTFKIEMRLCDHYCAVR
jgi:hypothetical protein